MSEMQNIVHIPSSVPFLDTLVSAILSGDLPHAGGRPPAIEELPEYTLLLPTRRACRSCLDAFLRISEGAAILLPHIRPIGESDADESLIDEVLTSGGSDLSLLNTPPAVTSLERQLVLTRFVLAWLEKGSHRPDLSANSQTGKK